MLTFNTSTKPTIAPNHYRGSNGYLRRLLPAAGLLCIQAFSSLAASNQNWPTWRYDAARSGTSPFALAEKLHLHWVRELPTPRKAWPTQYDDHGKLDFDVSYEPVAANGMLFVPSMVTDSVTAYSLDSGEKIWRFYTDGPVRLAPAWFDGRLYVGSDDGSLYCLDAETGGQIWRFEAAPNHRQVLGNRRLISVWPVRGAPLVADGIVYIAAGVWPFEGVYRYALDAETAEIIWQHSGVGEWSADAYSDAARSFSTISPQGYIALDGERLIISGGRTTPGIFERETGKVIRFNRVHKVHGGFAVAANASHHLLPVDHCEIQTGDQEHSSRHWSQKIGKDVWRLLTADGRMIAVTTCGRIYVFGEAEREPRHYTHAPDPLPEPNDAHTMLADALLDASGIQTGVALVFGIGDGHLLDALLLRSDLHLAVFDPDPETVARFRERYLAAGFDGERIAIRVGDARSHRLPPYVAGLIVSADVDAVAPLADPDTPRALFGALRPYGGILHLTLDAAEQAGFLEAFAQSGYADEAVVTRANEDLRLHRPGPLPGSDLWTHQYADAANSGFSADDRVRAPLGLTWYGNVDNHMTLPRHMFGPKPQVAGGRLVILGVDHISARCVYTGFELWSAEYPGVGEFFTNPWHEDRYVPGNRVYFPSHHGANFVGSPYVTTPDSIYLVYDNRCLRLDADTGLEMAVFELPDREGLHAWLADGVKPSAAAQVTDRLDPRWGHISTDGDYLIVGAYPHIFGERPDRPDEESPRGINHISPERGVPWHWNATSSEYLLALNRKSGKIQWVHHARYGFRHNAIVTGNGRTFVVDHLSPEVMTWLARRGVTPDTEPEILAIDLADGDVLWRYNRNVFGTWLSYSKTHDVLIQTGRRGGRSVLPDEPGGQLVALRGTDGADLWEINRNFRAPLALHESLQRIFPQSLDLLTGSPVLRENPLTGQAEPWNFTANKRCGSQSLSRHLLAFRSSMASFHDLRGEGGTANLSGVRSGCTDNSIVADGVLNLPDYTRTCSCAYQLQTSAAMAHMPEIEMWTTHTFQDPEPGTIRRLGINLGAPGDRRGDNATLWVHTPRQAPSNLLDIRIDNVKFEDVPVRVESIGASSGDALPTLSHRPEIQAQFDRWDIRSNQDGAFNAWLQYNLSNATTLNQVEMEWNGRARLLIQTSLDAEQWETVFENETAVGGQGPMTYPFEPAEARHLRIMFAEDPEGEGHRQLWVRNVRIGGLSDPDAYVYFLPQPYFREHAMLYHADNDGIPWVASSGIRGIRELTVGGLQGNGQRYRVCLHFAEPDEINAGDRVFDVLLQGRTVAESVDILRLAGSRRRAHVLTFTDIAVTDDLTITFRSPPGAHHPPLLSGVEIVASVHPDMHARQ